MPLGTLGLGPRAVGPGPHCVLRDAAHVGTHGDSSPPRTSSPGEPLASGPNPPNFVLVAHSVQFGMASPHLPDALSEGISPLGCHVLLCSKLLASASGIGAQCRTWVRGHNLLCGGGGGLGGQLQGGALP